MSPFAPSSFTPFGAPSQSSEPAQSQEQPRPAAPKLAPPTAAGPPSGSTTPAHHLSSDEGSSSTDEEERRKRFATTPKNNRFLEMKKQRPALREKYIQQGILPDPLKPQQLSDAANFRGSCMDMCPEFEREEREFQGEGDELEVYPGSTKLDPAIAVKIYRRPAAGRELPLPEDVRPPEVLEKTLDYLLYKVVPPQPDSDRLANVQGFVWNRTRAIRQDFIVQGEASPLTIQCHERIARWHILSLHWRGGSVDGQGQLRDSWPADRDPWSQQQELEQLAKTLTSLCEFYDDLRLTSGQEAPSPHEAEFRAYHLILNIFDPEVLRVVELLPEAVFDAPILQSAIKFRAYAQRSNRGGSGRANQLNTDAPMNLFSRFFAEIKLEQVPYLLACMLENQFGPVREGALKALSSNYNKAHRGPTLTFVQRALGADSPEEVAKWAEICDIEVLPAAPGEGGGAALKLHKQKIIDFAKVDLGSFSLTLVEAKRGRRTCQQIVDGDQAAAMTSTSSFAPSQPAQTAARSTLGSTGSAAFDSFDSIATAKLSPFAPSFRPKEPAAQPAFAREPSAKTAAFSLPATSAAPSSAAFDAPAPAPATGGFSFSRPSTSATPAAGTSAGGPSAFASSSAWTSAPQQSQPKALSQPTHGAKPSTPSSDGAAHSSFMDVKPPAPVPRAPAAKCPPRPPPVSTSEASSALQQRLIDEVVSQQSRMIAEQALAAEVKRRRTFARNEALDTLAQRLLTRLVGEGGDESREESTPAKLAADLAREAFSQEWSRRSTLRSRLDRWVARWEMKREEQRQRERFEYVRQRVRERGLIASSSEKEAGSSSWGKRGGMRSVMGAADASMSIDSTNSTYSSSAASNSLRRSLITSLPITRAGSKRPLDEDDEDVTMSDVQQDAQLRASFRRFTSQRHHLWAEGTFFLSIATHIADLAARWRPAAMADWSFTLVSSSSDGEESGAEQWLKHKFGFVDGTREKELPVGKELSVRGEMLELDHDDEEEGEDDVMANRCSPSTGLVIYPLPPALANRKALSTDGMDQAWDLEAHRLQRLSSSASNGPLTGNHFAPYLLVVDWGAAADRRKTLSRLGLTKTTEPWKAIEVVSLGGLTQAGQDDIDSVFARSVVRFVRDFPLLRYPLGTAVGAGQTVTTLDELVATIQRPWDEALVGVQALLARLPAQHASTKAIRGGLVRAAIEAVTTLLAMANHGITALLNNAETLIEEEDESTSGALMLPRLDVESFLARLPRGNTVNEALARLGRELVKDLLDRDDHVGHEADEDGDETMRSQAGPSGGLLMAQALLSQPSSSSFPLTTFLSSLAASRLDLLANHFFLCVREDDDEDEGRSSKARVEIEAQRMADWGKRAVQLLDGRMREALAEAAAQESRDRPATSDAKQVKKLKPESPRREERREGRRDDFAPSGDVAKLRHLIASANSLLSPGSPSASAAEV
ncbi:hypothetical protein BDZ90DRAFT_230299 [Jaminaea rosea]|uniref:SAC3/GANP/THP3 conserved domain-containing protein n=1 Tax=Jaminaea rosea TaxID=1569628 RepID=A0A316V1X7_9BASI|nr:hypothetical protein BDZ90DRAFT_230299 [Jaminaea rosea]PWN29425.1 hypothetical protein BDZ90DRAFT_230299 [Jaminaea rosea]